MIERFCKKLDCTASHGLNTHPSVPMSSNKNNGNVAFLFFQLGLQLQTRHPWHADVNDQARGFAMQIGFEELLRGSEAPCRKPRRLQKIAQRILHGLIIINDRNQFGRSVRRHAARLTSWPHWEQSNFGRAKLDFSRSDRYLRWIDHAMPTGGTQRLSGPELVRHPDKLRQGFGLHLFHDLAAIHFDSRFAGTEFRCDLLVKHPSNDQVHYLAQDARSRKGSLDRIKQILLPEWLCQKLNRSRLHGLDRHRNVSVSREKNY